RAPSSTTSARERLMVISLTEIFRTGRATSGTICTERRTRSRAISSRSATVSVQTPPSFRDPHVGQKIQTIRFPHVNQGFSWIVQLPQSSPVADAAPQRGQIFSLIFFSEPDDLGMGY